MYNKSDFLNHIDSLIPDGFERTKDIPVFRRVERDRELTIQISTRDYFPHGVYISGVIADISLFEIESIYQEVLQNNPLPESVLQTTSSESLLEDSEFLRYIYLVGCLVEKASESLLGDSE